MSNLVFSYDDGVSQLAAASQILIDEAIAIFSTLNIEELNFKQLNSFANTLLKNIDNTNTVVTALTGIPNEELVRCQLQLQQSIDKLYICLTETHNHWQSNIYSGDGNADDMIMYASFCSSLALKLLSRANQAVVQPENAALPVNIDEEMEAYL